MSTPCKRVGGLVLSGKRLWSLGDTQLAFSCVFRHFQQGDNNPHIQLTLSANLLMTSEKVVFCNTFLLKQGTSKACQGEDLYLGISWALSSCSKPHRFWGRGSFLSILDQTPFVFLSLSVCVFLCLFVFFHAPSSSKGAACWNPHLIGPSLSLVLTGWDINTPTSEMSSSLTSSGTLYGLTFFVITSWKQTVS